MPAVVKHAIGMLWAILSLLGAGFIYTAATSPSAVWYDQGVVGAICLATAIVLFRIWNRAMNRP